MIENITNICIGVAGLMGLSRFVNFFLINYNAQVTTASARIIARGNSTQLNWGTSYWLNFELLTRVNGIRKTEQLLLRVPYKEYQRLHILDTGALTYQGARYQGFQPCPIFMSRVHTKTP